MRKRNWLFDKRKTDNRVSWMIKNKINYFAPTISPAPKNKNEIESLKMAMDYYKPYTDKVVLQTKYMGSYCNVYLKKDLEETYFVSRNGYEIKRIDIEALKLTLKDLHCTLFAGNDLDMVILEGELMPWSALGKGLIDEEYRNYYNLNESHLTQLKSSSILEKLAKVKQSENYKVFNEYSGDNVKKDLKPHIVRQYREVQNSLVPDLKEYAKSIEVYKRQIDLFGKEEEPYINVFGILKYIKKNGTEFYPENNTEGFKLGHNIEGEQITINVDDYESANFFFEKHKDSELEGIMVKPYRSRLINICPCLKVRTNNYLQLIYGVNFDRNFDYYYNRRNVFKKINASVKAYELGLALLSIPYSDLNEENETYRELLYKVIGEETFIKTLDTRL